MKDRQTKVDTLRCTSRVTRPDRIAVVGTGVAGLTMLRSLRMHLPDAEVVAMNRTTTVRGCWGDPPAEFVSTSTRYATQLANFVQYEAVVTGDADDPSDFFRGGEFGDYLDAFADHFDLRSLIEMSTEVLRVRPHVDGGWSVTSRRDGRTPVVRRFDAVIICGGSTPRINDTASIDDDRVIRPAAAADLRDASVMVLGGGESAVDLAVKLSRPSRNNRVGLSLRRGIRVSPRYHPIGGVPSDYLRTRRMEGIRPGWRSAIGERFVRFRITRRRWLERWYPSRRPAGRNDRDTESRRVADRWAERLRRHAAGGLFDVYHNKSDEFLKAVGDGRLSILGPPINATDGRWWNFERTRPVAFDADAIVPAIGRRPVWPDLIGPEGGIVGGIDRFRWGMEYRDRPGLYLVGAVRPIIGNVPTLTEVQAEWIARRLCGSADDVDIGDNRPPRRPRPRPMRPNDEAATTLAVEMFRYCDALARSIGMWPPVDRGERRRYGWEPATTRHYGWPAVPPPPPTQRYLPRSLAAAITVIALLDRCTRRRSSSPECPPPPAPN